MASAAATIDRQDRTVRYLRMSGTDRCDLRCRYGMAESMAFLRGVRKLRLTGGEPPVRPDPVRRLARQFGQGLDELTLTANAARLAHHARMPFDAAMDRAPMLKPARHAFRLDDTAPAVARHMSVTGI